MRTALVATLLIVVGTGPSCHCGTGNASDQPGNTPLATSADDLFSTELLPAFHITLDDGAIASLQKRPRDYVRGSFRYGDETFPDVGVRLKGHRAMQGFDGKPAFKINLRKFGGKRKLFGLDRLTLNNMVEDPTAMREVLGYRLHRAVGVPAPRAGYALVYVNDELYGLYANVETVDEEFLDHHFDDDDGAMYEGEYGCDLYPDDVAGFEHEEGDDELGREQLARFADAPLAGIDRDRVLAYLAVSAVLGDFDGYRHSHNYRIYYEPGRGRWSFVPWGLDRTFKKRLDVYDSGGLIAKLCFADAACRADYARAVQRAVEAFEKLELAFAMDEIGTLIDPAVRVDPRRPHSLHDTRLARAAMRRFIAVRPAEVRAQVDCIADGEEVDRDGDGYGCLDCDDGDAAIHPGAAEACDGVDNDCSARVDDAPECECPEVEADGARFALCEHEMTWQEAAAFCEARGQSLARIDGRAQGLFVYEAAHRLDRGKWWIGLSDAATEGTFRWRDGAPVAYTGWGRGEPDNDACNQDCAALKDDGYGLWHDTHCASRLPFVCRVE